MPERIISRPFTAQGRANWDRIFAPEVIVVDCSRLAIPDKPPKPWEVREIEFFPPSQSTTKLLNVIDTAKRLCNALSAYGPEFASLNSNPEKEDHR